MFIYPVIVHIFFYVFQQKAEELLDQFYRQPRKKSIKEEKLKVIQLAAQVILVDISNSKCKVDDIYLAVSTADIDLLRYR